MTSGTDRRTKRLGHLAIILTIPMTACAAPLYLHSPSLEKATAKASSSLPDAATALKPFDDQLAALATFAGREDAAVAQYWATVRDAHFMRLIAADVETDRREILTNQINARLSLLAGTVDVDSNIVTRYRGAIEARATADREADAQRRRYRTAAPAGDERDLSCDAIAAPDAAPSPTRPPLAGIFQALTNACRSRRRYHDIVAGVETEFARNGGAIGQETVAMREKSESEAYRPSPRIAQLQAQIRDAATFAETGSASARLEAFRETLRGLATDLNAATRQAALDEASTTLDALLKGELCDSPAIEDEAKTEAGCGDIEATSTVGRAQAAWAFARALAQLADANAPNRRSVQWLLAAKAIVNGEKAEAQLQREQSEAEATARSQRHTAMLRELAQLIAARDSLQRRRATCHGGLPGGDRGPNPHCAFAAYVDSWNEGRIPAEILRYRSIQIERMFAVRRSRAVAQRQYALASAGTTSLRDYGAGGIRAAEVAQALADLTVIGLIPGD